MPNTPEEFMKERAACLIIGALAPFDHTTRNRIVDDAAAKLALIGDDKAAELMGQLRFAGMQGNFDDPEVQEELQRFFAQYVADFVNPEQS